MLREESIIYTRFLILVILFSNELRSSLFSLSINYSSFEESIKLLNPLNIISLPIESMVNKKAAKNAE